MSSFDWLNFRGDRFSPDRCFSEEELMREGGERNKHGGGKNGRYRRLLLALAVTAFAALRSSARLLRSVLG